MENEELVLQIQAGKNKQQNMEQLYTQNRPFIYCIATNYSSYADIEDLMQEAYFALEEAAKKFDPDKGVKFLTYLPYQLKSVLGKYICNCGKLKRIPAYEMERISKYRKYISDCKVLKGVEPTDQMICDFLEITQRQLNRLRKDLFESECISIDEQLPGSDDLTIGETLPDQENLENQVVTRLSESWATNLIWKIVDELDQKKSQIIVERYKESTTLKELAKRFCVSPERIRSIEHDALLLLRNKKQMRDIAEIYGYMSSYSISTGLQSFKYHGSAVEWAALRHIEGEKRMAQIKTKMDQTKQDLIQALDLDDLLDQLEEKVKEGD